MTKQSGIKERVTHPYGSTTQNYNERKYNRTNEDLTEHLQHEGEKRMKN